MIAAGCILVAGSAYAQGYPNKSIRIVVPQSPGGGNDAIARIAKVVKASGAKFE
jgi:tripartite-type tricarboxylate transporter receptor subunit TctC